MQDFSMNCQQFYFALILLHALMDITADGCLNFGKSKRRQKAKKVVVKMNPTDEYQVVPAGRYEFNFVYAKDNQKIGSDVGGKLDIRGIKAFLHLQKLQQLEIKAEGQEEYRVIKYANGEAKTAGLAKGYRLIHFDELDRIGKFTSIGGQNQTYMEEDLHRHNPFDWGAAKRVPVRGDGNCFYRAAALSMYGDTAGMHQELRKQVTTELLRISKNGGTDRVKAILDATLPGNLAEGVKRMSLREYAKMQRRPNNWASTVDAHVLAAVTRRNVLICQIYAQSSAQLHCSTFTPDYDMHLHQHIVKTEDIATLWEMESEPVVLFYNGSDHYDAIIRQEEN